jgi:hypothetical protein
MTFMECDACCYDGVVSSQSCIVLLYRLKHVSVVQDNVQASYNGPWGEWDSICRVFGYNGMPSFKIRPKTLSRHGRQYIQVCSTSLHHIITLVMRKIMHIEILQLFKHLRYV